MPQWLLDPTDTSSATRPASVPTTLPRDVREFGFIPDFKLWLPGDLLLFSAVEPNRAQTAIVEAQERLGYDPEDARWHHAAVYIGDLHLCEAVFRGVRYHSVTDMFLGSRLRIRRNAQLTDKERFRIAIRALMRLARPYGFWAVTLSWLRSRNTAFGRACSEELRTRGDAVICSQLYHEAYMEVTSQALSAVTDRDVIPADLSACGALVDVQTRWAKLP